MKSIAAAGAALAFVWAASASAQHVSDAEPITIDEALTVMTHDADRKLNVVLPRGYEQAEERFPLVLVLDGGMGQDFFLSLGVERWNQRWGRGEPAILIGVETVDRQRELLPPTQVDEERERYPSAGESEAFRTWLAETVLPILRARYRHDGRAMIVGESAAGHFVVETWLAQPDLFDGYAALSPSLQWNDSALAGAAPADDGTPRPRLFLSLADEGGATETGVMELRETLGARFCFADYRASHVHHSNSLHQLLPQALQYLLPTEADWLGEYGLTVECEMREADAE